MIKVLPVALPVIQVLEVFAIELGIQTAPALAELIMHVPSDSFDGPSHYACRQVCFLQIAQALG